MRWIALFLFIAACSMSAQQTTVPNTVHLATVRKLLREVPLIDGHNDLPWQFRRRTNSFDSIDLRQDNSRLKEPLVTDFPRLHAGCVGGQFWSVYIPWGLTNASAVQAVLEQIDVVHRM